MAFTHGKKARLFVDQYELTKYFNDFTLSGKAGIAETTVYGLGAKTFIGGIKEGTVSGKGFFGALTTDQVDLELAQALGRDISATDSTPGMAITLTPTGILTAGTRVICVYAEETDYQVSAPVTGVVATSFTAQADSGASTGVWLYNPTTAAIVTATTTTGTAVNDLGVSDSPTTTVAVGSNGALLSSFTGTQNLSVASSTGFATSGYVAVAASGGGGILQYNGTGAGVLNNCLLISGTGAWTLATGGAVAQPFNTTNGAIANVHVLTVGAAESDTFSLMHSDNGTTWVALASTPAITAVGGYTIIVPANQPIFRFLAIQCVTTGATISLTFGSSAARQ